MGYHSSESQDKCWSCQYFSGEREYKEGLFLGGSTRTSSNGLCLCKTSRYFNKEVSESSSCAKYQKWGVLASVIAKKEAEECERQLKIEKERNEQERISLERQRLLLEEERKQLEYEKWYSTLTLEEKEKENLRIQLEKERLAREAEERKLKEEQEEKERESKRLADLENKKQKKKVFLRVFAVIIAILTSIIVVKNIAESVAEKQRIKEFETSETGRFIAYVEENFGFDNNTFSIKHDREDGSTAYYKLEYKESGWINNGTTYDFRVTVRLTPRSGESFKEIYGIFCFNLDGSNQENSFSGNGQPSFSSQTIYGSGYVITTYQRAKYDTVKSALYYDTCFHNYTDWDNQYNGKVNEWKTRGWKACELAYATTNELYKMSVGGSMYK